MLSKKIEKILNDQIEKEGYSSNLYLAMASWAEKEGFAGISQWLYAQAEEERMHMLKFVSFINERGGHAVVPAFAKPPVKFEGIKKMFDQVLEHEQFITKSINEIVALAIKENDFAINNWIQWFVTEQMEEESNVQTIIDKLNLLGDKNFYIFDRDIMGLRTAE
ncbi:MAG: ferritin [Bacteroidetes bacterium GWF2_33_16]|nr:MAG: ferritin [Bacteroidetes bacterium GWE2_32_14]OFY02274.1 MAG: ferritin [Bacteroidetes bacterium GWF2_33_16]